MSSNNQTRKKEKRIRFETSLSTEAYGLLKAESNRLNQSMGEILDKLILEGCQYDEELPYETHSAELEEAKKRLDASFKVDLV